MGSNGRFKTVLLLMWAGSDFVPEVFGVRYPLITVSLSIFQLLARRATFQTEHYLHAAALSMLDTVSVISPG